MALSCTNHSTRTRPQARNNTDSNKDTSPPRVGKLGCSRVQRPHKHNTQAPGVHRRGSSTGFNSLLTHSIAALASDTSSHRHKHARHASSIIVVGSRQNVPELDRRLSQERARVVLQRRNMLAVLLFNPVRVALRRRTGVGKEGGWREAEVPAPILGAPPRAASAARHGPRGGRRLSPICPRGFRAAASRARDPARGRAAQSCARRSRMRSWRF